MTLTVEARSCREVTCTSERLDIDLNVCRVAFRTCVAGSFWDELQRTIRWQIFSSMRRLGQLFDVTSRSAWHQIVKLVFTSNMAAAHVTMRYTIFPVLPYMKIPPKCSKCCGFEYVESVSTRCARCPHWSKTQNETAFDEWQAHCLNCRKNHEISSTPCPVYKREKAIYEHKREYKTDYLIVAKRRCCQRRFCNHWRCPVKMGQIQVRP